MSARAFVYVAIGSLVTLLALGAVSLSASDDNSTAVVATIQANKAFRSPGSKLSALYLATAGGRISLMGDSDVALMAWLVRHEGQQVVVTLVKETR